MSMTNSADDTSIGLSNLIQNSERESAAMLEDEGHRSSIAKWPKTEEVLNLLRVQTKIIPPVLWGKVFKVACALGVFIDPLFCYVYFIDEGKKCYGVNILYALAYIVFRSAIDLVYFTDLIILLWEIYSKRDTVSSRQRKRLCKLYLCILLRGIFFALPIPQIIIFVLGGDIGVIFVLGVFSAGIFLLLLVLTAVQYILRVYHAHGLLVFRLNFNQGKRSRLQAVLDFLPFMVASHLFGALWYVLAVFRELRCWVNACNDGSELGCLTFYFRCGYELAGQRNISHIVASCPIHSQDPNEFGLYSNAIQMNMLGPANIVLKISQCFGWALRNLSSFGSNLQPNLDMVEITFSTLMSITGIMLFLLYLNKRVQVSQKRSLQHKLKKKMQMMNPDIDLWLYKNNLSDNKDLKKVIKNSLEKRLEQNKDVDMEDILSILPIANKRHIMCSLGLASLKKVPMLEKVNENVLKVICEHFRPVIYTEGSYIFREGEPLEKMLVITQGTAWCYPTSSANANIGGSSSGSSMIECLKKGNFYGEELLNWALKLTFEFPNSTRIVKAQTKVEAFAIMAYDLDNVVRKFWCHFSKMLNEREDSPLEMRQNLAASFILARWRRNHPRPV